MMSNISNEIVCEGWLTKSPPSKRLWKARWRKRWFVLKHSGEIPGQFFLLYYTDRNCRKLKGTIDLDQCEQVDAGLRFENSKQIYPHMFDVKTPKRTYYLAADTETEMNKWVDNVCQVCGLRASVEDTSVEFIEENSDSLQGEGDCGARNRKSKKSDPTPDRTYALDLYDGEHGTRLRDVPFSDSPPVSPTTSVSGPYIPISECHSGKPLNTPKGISDFNNIISRQELSNSKISGKECFTANILRSNNMKQTICADDISKCDVNKPVALPMPVQSQSKPLVVERLNSLYEDRKNVKTRREDKITNIESAKKMAEMKKEAAVTDEFYDSPRKVVAADDEWQRPVPPAAAPAPNWETFPAQDEADFTPGDIGSWSVVNRCGKLTVVDSKLPIVTNSLNRACKQKRQPDTNSLRRPIAPPRPPKPQHLIIPEQPRAEVDGECTPNAVDADDNSSLSSNTEIVTEETYDIPRSHQPHDQESHGTNNYTNAAPTKVQGNVFRYDFSESEMAHPSVKGEPISPRSEGSVAYSNLPSPMVQTQGVPTPPAVNRELKPTRKMSDSGASSEPSPGPYTPSLCPITPSYSSEPSPLGMDPPSIDRTLKPKKNHSDGVSIKLARPPDSSLGMRRVRAGPSPTPPNGVSAGSKRSTRLSSGTDDDVRHSPDIDQIYFYERSSVYSQITLPHIQYLDLDLDSDAASGPLSTPPANSCPSATPYKTIDFLKTEAFNRTREEMEEKRKEVP